MNIESLIFWPLITSLVIGMMVTPIVIMGMRRLGFVIDPKKMQHPAHVHTKPIPKGGGIVVLIGVVMTLVMSLPIDKHLLAIFLALFLCVVVGVIDDIRGMSPLVRLGFNFLCALIVVGAGIGIPFVTNPFGGIIDLSQIRVSFNLFGEVREIWILADLFALLWIPFLMNAINWSSGVDGQVSGVVAVSAVVIGLLSFTFGTDTTQWPISVLAFATTGVFAALAVYSFFPQKIMPGYSATTAAGLLLATMSILSTAKIGTAMVVMGLPLLDAGITIVRRLVRGKKPWEGDREHFHHLLLRIGWSKRKIALFYWLFSALWGIVALFGNTQIKIGAFLLMGTFIIGISIWLHYWDYSRQHAQDNG